MRVGPSVWLLVLKQCLGRDGVALAQAHMALSDGDVDFDSFSAVGQDDELDGFSSDGGGLVDATSADSVGPADFGCSSAVGQEVDSLDGFSSDGGGHVAASVSAQCGGRRNDEAYCADSSSSAELPDAAMRIRKRAAVDAWQHENARQLALPVVD